MTQNILIGFCPPYYYRSSSPIGSHDVRACGNRRRATPPTGQHFRDTLIQLLTERFFLDQLDVTGEETDTCETVRFYLLASFMDPRFRELSFLTETERSTKTVKAMPSLPASSDVASTTSLETEILPPPKKKSRSEVAMEELLDKGKSSNSSGESTGQVESRAEKNQRIDWEIQQRGTNWFDGRPVNVVERKPSRTDPCCQCVSSSANI